MKTILFFDRCDLTRLYILLTKELSKEYNVVHVAYSNIEALQLEAAGINDYIDLEKELSKYLSSQIDEQIISEIDHFIIERSNGLFNLNASIQADRGYSILNYNEALLLAQSYYLTWKKIYSDHHVDLMFHEACSLYMVYIAALLCKSQGGDFYYMQQSASDSSQYTYMFLDGENYSCPELEQKYTYYKDHADKIDMDRVKAFISSFRQDNSAFMGNLLHRSHSRIKILIDAYKYDIIRILKSNKYDRLKNNIDYWLFNKNNTNAERLYNLKHYKKRAIVFQSQIPEGERFYYYSIHLEPESTTYYLGEGIYANQIKLIENIAAALPPGTFLYVKDHPHEYAYRNAEDYYRLMKVPNIRLIHQSVSGKYLIKKSIGVFSINGTAGFEAIMMGKQVYCFAQSYYSFYERVNYIRNIKDAREVIYSNMSKKDQDDTNLYAFVFSYLQSNHPGFTAYFNLAVESELDEQENASMIADEIRRFK